MPFDESKNCKDEALAREKLSESGNPSSKLDEKAESVKGPFSKKQRVAIIGAVAFVAAVACLLACIAPIPDLAGLTVDVAEESMNEVSDAWKISYVTEDGEEFVDSQKGDYEVVSTNPSAGQLVNRFDGSQNITVVVSKTDEALLAERETLIDETQNRIAHRNGWAKGRTNDSGAYIELSSNYLSRTGDGYFWSPGGPQSETALDYRRLASEVQATIIAPIYTQDGYLTELYVAPFQGVSETDFQQAANHAAEIVNSARDFNYQHADELIATYCDLLQELRESEGVLVTIEYSIDASTAHISFMYEWSTMEWLGNAHEKSEAVRDQEELTQWLAWVTGREATITHYESDDEVFYSATASPDGYEVLTLVEPVI